MFLISESRFESQSFIESLTSFFRINGHHPTSREPQDIEQVSEGMGDHLRAISLSLMIQVGGQSADLQCGCRQVIISLDPVDLFNFLTLERAIEKGEETTI
jgi:hypothetical protein